MRFFIWHRSPRAYFWPLSLDTVQSLLSFFAAFHTSTAYRWGSVGKHLLLLWKRRLFNITIKSLATCKSCLLKNILYLFFISFWKESHHFEHIQHSLTFLPQKNLCLCNIWLSCWIEWVNWSYRRLRLYPAFISPSPVDSPLLWWSWAIF